MKTNISMLQQEAPYLDSSRNKLLFISFLTTFTFIFLSVYTPFNMNQWGGSILGYVTIGASVILLSQFVLRSILKKQKFKLHELIVFGMGEILVIAFFIQLVYGPELLTGGEKLAEYLLTLKYVSLITVGPYLLSIWYMAFRQKFTAYKKVANNKPVLNTDKNDELFTITGENNKIILAIKYDTLLYVKSSGNYLDIYYLKGNKVSKELVRSSLKELEAKITDSSIIRVHRSYMVNKHKISSFKKTRKGYKLVMQHVPEVILPISLGYKNKFEEALELKLSH